MEEGHAMQHFTDMIRNNRCLKYSRSVASELCLVIAWTVHGEAIGIRTGRRRQCRLVRTCAMADSSCDEHSR